MEKIGGIEMYLGDCLEVMKGIPNGCVDMVLCDLPYGLLNKSNPAAKWDCPIPTNVLWNEYKRIVKSDGAIVLFGQGMYTAKMMISNPKMWRYNLVWKKGNRITLPMMAKIRPLPNHEDIMVFYKKRPSYNPQMTKGKPNHSMGSIEKYVNKNNCYGNIRRIPTRQDGIKYPKSVLDFEKDYGKFYHPTQKPVALLEYLIRTYTNGGDTVLDNCMGSGSTMVACMNTGRRGIGIEIMEEYYDIAVSRACTAHEKLTDLFTSIL